jgi:DNA-binding HxlR family transcriptional regulator
LEIIGGKWKGVILYHLMERTYRFGELKRVTFSTTICKHKKVHSAYPAFQDKRGVLKR